MKRYMNAALPYAVLAMIGGVFPAVTLIGKELFFHRCENWSGTGCLSYWFESDSCDVCRAGNGSGAGACTFRWYECSDIWYRRNWAYLVGCQYGASTGANQA